MVRNWCGPSGIFSDQRSARSSSRSQFPLGVTASHRPAVREHPDRFRQHPFEVDDVLQHVDREDAVEPGVAEREPLADRHHAVGPIAAGPHQEHLPAQVAGDGRRAPERVEQIAAAAAQLQQPGPSSQEPADQAAVSPFARSVCPPIVLTGDFS